MTGVEGEISRDIERTFPANPFFSGKGIQSFDYRSAQEIELTKWLVLC